MCETWKQKNHFESKELIAKYGNWVKVQVAFYDFIFEESTKLCCRHFNEKSFRDGVEYYDKTVDHIKGKFPNFEDAWREFIKSQQQGDAPPDDRIFRNRGDR